jgi:hypothetical protein
LVHTRFNLHQLQVLTPGAFNIGLLRHARFDLHRPTADAAVLAAAAAAEAAKATVTALVFAAAIAALVTIIAAALLATS